MNDTIIWSPGVTLDQVEERVFKKAFIHFRGNKTAMANSLGCSVRTIDNKFERYAAEDKKREEAAEQLREVCEERLARARGIKRETPVEVSVAKTSEQITDLRAKKRI